MKATSKTSGRRCPFTQQVTSTRWMSLPQDVLCTRSLQGFKKQQDEHMGKKTTNTQNHHLNNHTRSASKSPQCTNWGRLGNVWETYDYTFAFKLCSLLCMHYQPLLETGCWAPRTLGVTQHSCSSPVHRHFFAWWGQKAAVDSQWSVPEGTPKPSSLGWLYLIRERYFAQNEIGQRLKSGHVLSHSPKHKL